MKILIVEDERTLAKSIASFLTHEKHICEVASTFEQGSDRINLYQYDCILLDIGLPDGNGLELLKMLKTANKTDGVIIISAKDSLDDRLTGLNFGADDYLLKPFHLSELNARIHAVMRRRNFDGNPVIIFDVIEINSSSRQVSVKGDEVILTAKEYDLLLYFLANKSRVVSKNSIAEHLWGDVMDQADSFNFLYSHIKNLRKKLMDKGAPDYIHTVYGIGYNFKKP
jgi:DNA-binding response OmpR family regulator